MSQRAKLIRVLMTVVVGACLVLGSWKGEDDNFPFGPFRMYSTKQMLDGRVRGLQLWGRHPCGPFMNLVIEDFGLRRADLEGQLGKLAVEPTVLLTELERSYRRLHGGSFPFETLQLRDKIYQLESGRPVRESFNILGTRSTPSDLVDPCP